MNRAVNQSPEKSQGRAGGTFKKQDELLFSLVVVNQKQRFLGAIFMFHIPLSQKSSHTYSEAINFSEFLLL